jgi:predicted nucleotide-binding protein
MAARDALFVFLRSIGLEPLEWSNVVQMARGAPPYVDTVLEAEAARAVVVLLTPEDMARPNVLFETGMAIGRYEIRIVLVQLGEMPPFSDFAGLQIVPLDNSPQKRKELAERLKTAGCSIDLRGRFWLSAGDFAVP